MRFFSAPSAVRLLTAVSIGVATLAPLQVQAACDAEIHQQISTLDIPAEKIRKTEIVGVYDSSGAGGSNRIDRYEGWVSFTDCKGNLVVVVDKFCRPKQNYTTYQCKVSGVKGY
ncbi:MAG: hypothetical protein EP348_08835 [Alphaproteobacteria bacterium]|nr:MAG: hypothetical protein EP348_08835 [Alphaproteobacteria bacterium]